MLIDTTRLELAFKERFANPTPESAQGIPTNRADADAHGAVRQDLLFQIAEAELAFAESLAPLMERYAAHVSSLKSDVAEIEEGLKSFHRVEIAVAHELEEPEPLTIKLESVELHSTEGQPKWVYTDDKAFDAWCVANVPDSKIVKDPQADKNVVKRVVKNGGETGEVITYKGQTIPGVTVKPAERTFRVV